MSVAVMGVMDVMDSTDIENTVMENVSRAKAGFPGGLVLLLTCLLLLSPLASATQVRDLYQVEVPVSGQGKDERDKAVSRAMSEVLVRVTGQRKTLSHPEIKTGLQRATSFLQGYSYRREEVDGQRQLILLVGFNERAITLLLRENGIGIWGENRSTTLMWLAVQQGKDREIQGSGTNSELRREIDSVFGHRALPVIFPVMDFEDNLVISAVDVWGLFSSKLTQASVRYGSESVLGGRLAMSETAKGKRYNGRLVLLFRHQRFEANIDGLSAEGVALALADLVGTTLSGHYAVTFGSGSEKPVLVVEDIDDTKAYAGVIAYVESLTAVRNVTVRKVSGSKLELELTIDGTVGQLSDSIALERRLRRVSADVKPASGTGQDYLHFRWSGRR